MQKLGKNIGSYHGERIEIASVLRDIRDHASACGWSFDSILSGPQLELPAWHRAIQRPRRRVYLSAGIHGDEPAGPLAARRLVQENTWPDDIELWLCPCLNPTGFAVNRRENAHGIDLNRQYLHPEAAETRAHVEWLHLGCSPCFGQDCSLGHLDCLNKLLPEQVLRAVRQALQQYSAG